MSIVKRKNVSGGTYYFNTTTKKFASEASYKKSKSAPIANSKPVKESHQQELVLLMVLN